MKSLFSRALCGGLLPLTLLVALNSNGSVLISEIMYHPASEDVREEFIELHNPGATNVNLTGWRFSKGVQFTFPDITLAPNSYLAVAADLAAFTNKYPAVTHVVGGWTGRLSNSRERIELEDAAGTRVDRVDYADEGDWAVRLRTPPHFNHRGWTWQAEADGLGKSLELINPALPNEHGQNWASSLVLDGTPGAPNSVAQTNLAPMILEARHWPPMPRSLDSVLVTARLLDEQPAPITATLYWRRDGAVTNFNGQPMFDDGLHNDGVAGDGLFAAILPAQPNNAVVEFYIEAVDQTGLTRTWPAPAVETNGVSLGQAANALYQVDDAPYTDALPLYKLIMKEADRLELAQIGSAPYPGESQSDAQMNGTFVSLDATGVDVRYTVGLRNRGHGSRNRKPNNYRVNFCSDRPWKGVVALNLNAQFTHSQILGSALALKSGLVAAHSQPAQVRVNNANLGNNGPQTYGAVYAANQAINSDWAGYWFPDDDGGNVYRVIRDIRPPNFDFRGTNHTAYTNTYFKETNTSENDWTDLMAMLEVMGENQTNLFTVARARQVINLEQWLLHIAVMSLFANGESGLNTGNNDDYFMYRGVDDARFLLVPYDLDQILGQTGSLAANTSIFRAACCPISGDTEGVWRMMNFFLHHPEIEPLYLRTMQRLLETTFSKPEFDLTIDQTLGGFVPASVITTMKSWMDSRRDYVESVLAPFVATNGIAPVATVAGEPRSPTPLRSATLAVGGAGVAEYRFSLNSGPFGGPTPVTTPIVLQNLPPGSTNVVRVVGADTNGLWQSETLATVSRSWVVNTNWPAVRINEVLARNVAAFNHHGTFPDAIELYNESGVLADLSGLRLTDNPAAPGKYTFPAGTTLDAGGYLVVFAGNDDGTPGLHTGFALNQDGEGVYLFDRVANGGALLDGVTFGLQLADLSLGRLAGGGEFVLTQPTFGSNNVAQPVADPRQLKLNEWLAKPLAMAGDDYVELFNPSPLPAPIGGLFFTDNPIGEPLKSLLAPHSFIGGGGFRRFIADGKPQQGYDHLNFQLAAEQGLIALLLADLRVIDLIVYGPQRPDQSEGRVPDGGNRLEFFNTPTPGAPNTPVLPCVIVTSNLNLMAFDHVWKFNQTTNLDGLNWQANDYDDTAWESGPGLLAFENNAAINGLIQTTLADPRTPPPGLTPGHAYYFRARLDLPSGLGGYTVTASAYIDDGAVVYVNGSEVSPRIRMPAGVITNASFATGTPPGSDATNPDVFLIPASLFVPGENVIAVEVHQTSSNSGDIVWGLALSASRQTTVCGQSTVVLNEVFASNRSLTNAAGRTPDWIELFNVGTNSFDLSDLSLTDRIEQPRRWVFPPGSVLSPGARRLIEWSSAWPPSSTNTGFNLRAGGGSVYLVHRPADGGMVLDSIRYGLQAPDFSIGRLPDGSGDWALTLPTPDAANVAAGLGNASSLKFNEWMASATDGPDWFELYNPLAQPVELSGLSLTDNPTAPDRSPLPPLSFIGPAGYQMLVADGNRGAGADHVAFQLEAAGEYLGLYWSLGTQIDAVSFGPQAVNVSQGCLPDGASTWASFTNTISPAAPNHLLLTNLFINELLSHTDPPLEDAVEIFNAGAEAVDISGWFLSDDELNPTRFRVPDGTLVAGGGFAVFYEYQFGPGATPPTGSPFSFNSARSGQVLLSQTDGGGSLTGIRARARFGAATNGVSFGRFLTSVGEEFVAMSRRSFGVDNPTTLEHFRLGTGAANPYPLVGPVVFSEIHYLPVTNYAGNTNAAEFLELLNVSSQPVPLYDPAAPTNTWRISGGVDFAFPQNVTLPVGGAALVVSFDPVADPAQADWLRAAYQVPPGVPVLGPWSGALANEGEHLELLKPDPPQLPPAPDAGFVPYVRVEHVSYQPVAPWPTNGMREGNSLQRAVPKGFGNEPLFWIASAPSAGVPLADTDGDGLPDYWETQNGLSPTNSSGWHGAGGDPDQDGQSNHQEYLAGTNPQNGDDFFHIKSVAVDATSVTLRFHAASGRTYSVLFSDNSPAGPWHILADIPFGATSRLVEIDDPGFAAANRRFYRLTAPALPNP